MEEQISVVAEHLADLVEEVKKLTMAVSNVAAAVDFKRK